ncbi:LuxR C-terminal-related transcriptional regulator [Nocardia sp. NBC_01388]|uniref:LuxR C-terminal-related transcriptional regulator n=1 Tax=Nocardia sp. NBC_01388 TaxID=2903596 RepID=UPI00325514DD
MITPQEFASKVVSNSTDKRSAGLPSLSFRPIDRPVLLDRIDLAIAMPQTRVLMICGAAGSGKTVLLADWVSRAGSAQPGAEVCWLTITEDMDQGHRLWNALRARLAVPDAPRPGLLAPLADAVELVDTLTDRAAPVVLVIDDAHLLTDPIALAGLEHFLLNAPTTVTTIIAARFDPPIRWHSLELTGQLERVPAAELAMTQEQVAQVCRQHLPNLTPEELRTVTDLTRGWAALVRITAIYLAASNRDRATALTALARPAQAVSDFIVGELIDTLSPQLRLFLTYTSIPESFTEQLADELVGGGAVHRLYELDRINFPCTHELRGDDLWFSYHPMLRSYLRAEANRLGNRMLSDLHLRTAEWLRSADQPLTALPHLLDGPGESHLRCFLADSALDLVLRGRGGDLFATLHRLRPEIADDPFIWLLRGADALLYGDATDALTILDMAAVRRTNRTSFVPDSWIEALSAATAAYTAVMTGSAPERVVIPNPLPLTGEAGIDCYTMIQFAFVKLAQGDVADGEELLHSALVLAEHGPGGARLIVQAVTRLATAAGIRGDITSMQECSERAVAIATENAVPGNPDITLALTMSALASYLQGEDPAPAQVAAALAVHPRQDGSSGPVAGWHAFVLGHLLQLEQSADISGAVDALRHSLLELLERQAVPLMSGGLVPHAVWALLRAHEPRTATLLVERARQVLGDTDDIVVARAALALTANSPIATRSMVLPLIRSDNADRPISTITAWLLHAVSHIDAPMKAREGLENALRLAARDRLIRPFLDIPQVLHLLDSFAGQLGRHDVFAEIVRRHPKARRDTAHHTLTTTEVTVLRLLPSGRTVQQIADDLGVSINTVKTHLRGIYAKLGTNTRGDAVGRARFTGLI